MGAVTAKYLKEEQRERERLSDTLPHVEVDVERPRRDLESYRFEKKKNDVMFNMTFY